MTGTGWVPLYAEIATRKNFKCNNELKFRRWGRLKRVAINVMVLFRQVKIIVSDVLQIRSSASLVRNQEYLNVQNAQSGGPSTNSIAHSARIAGIM